MPRTSRCLFAAIVTTLGLLVPWAANTASARGAAGPMVTVKSGTVSSWTYSWKLGAGRDQGKAALCHDVSMDSTTDTEPVYLQAFCSGWPDSRPAKGELIAPASAGQFTEVDSLSLQMFTTRPEIERVRLTYSGGVKATLKRTRDSKVVEVYGNRTRYWLRVRVAARDVDSPMLKSVVGQVKVCKGGKCSWVTRAKRV